MKTTKKPTMRRMARNVLSSIASAVILSGWCWLLILVVQSFINLSITYPGWWQRMFVAIIWLVVFISCIDPDKWEVTVEGNA